MAAAAAAAGQVAVLGHINPGNILPDAMDAEPGTPLTHAQACAEIQRLQAALQAAEERAHVESEQRTQVVLERDALDREVLDLRAKGHDVESRLMSTEERLQAVAKQNSSMTSAVDAAR